MMSSNANVLLQEGHSFLYLIKCFLIASFSKTWPQPLIRPETLILSMNKSQRERGISLNIINIPCVIGQTSEFVIGIDLSEVGTGIGLLEVGTLIGFSILSFWTGISFLKYQNEWVDVYFHNNVYYANNL